MISSNKMRMGHNHWQSETLPSMEIINDANQTQNERQNPGLCSVRDDLSFCESRTIGMKIPECVCMPWFCVHEECRPVFRRISGNVNGTWIHKSSKISPLLHGCLCHHENASLDFVLFPLIAYICLCQEKQQTTAQICEKKQPWHLINIPQFWKKEIQVIKCESFTVPQQGMKSSNIGNGQSTI